MSSLERKNDIFIIYKQVLSLTLYNDDKNVEILLLRRVRPEMLVMLTM